MFGYQKFAGVRGRYKWGPANKNCFGNGFISNKLNTCECYGGAHGTFCEHYIYPDLEFEKEE